MAYVIDNGNVHPCNGKDCCECETCIFDIDINEIQPKVLNKNRTMNEMCNKCPNLIKNFIDDDRLAFNACCGKVIIDYGNYSRPRVIKYKTGQMIDIDTPSWCPKKNGIDKQILKPIGDGSYTDESNDRMLALPTQVAPPSQETPKQMTYYEKREAMKKLPRRVKWEDIKENEIFVIPKILSQARKVVRILMKTDGIIRYNEINEYGVESTYCSTMYPNDIETVFITKLHKY